MDDFSKRRHAAKVLHKENYHCNHQQKDSQPQAVGRGLIELHSSTASMRSSKRSCVTFEAAARIARARKRASVICWQRVLCCPGRRAVLLFFFPSMLCGLLCRWCG
jgi:hypothetical protein